MCLLGTPPVGSAQRTPTSFEDSKTRAGEVRSLRQARPSAERGGSCAEFEQQAYQGRVARDRTALALVARDYFWPHGYLLFSPLLNVIGGVSHNKLGPVTFAQLACTSVLLNLAIVLYESSQPVIPACLPFPCVWLCLAKGWVSQRSVSFIREPPQK